MLLKDEVVGCENCKKCKGHCQLLPDLSESLFDYKCDRRKQWEFMKKGVENCDNCGKCDDACPCAFKEEYRLNGGADKCPRFEEETDPMQVLENMEKGLKLLQDIIGINNGVIPF